MMVGKWTEQSQAIIMMVSISLDETENVSNVYVARIIKNNAVRIIFRTRRAPSTLIHHGIIIHKQVSDS